ncbi:hypothetical protein [Streptomyces antimycoticus]|uniref:hypothetical protein n=1 Tax=Streptomyces antimycoticus TaxID=68175 RepID=UPI00367B7B68
MKVTDAGQAAVTEMSAEVLKISDTLNATLGPDDIAAADQHLRRAALVVENELREMKRPESDG